jgi:small-conductance mechanosensitive channel
MPPMLDVDLPNWAELGLRVVGIAVVALVAFLVVRAAIQVAVRHLLEARAAEAEDGALSAVELERRMRTLERLSLRLAGGLILIVAGLMVLDAFEINVGPAIAGFGVAGIAVGFGAQSLVRDWLAGVFVIVENQYSQGDVVRIADVDGVVEDFSLRRTVLRDLDGTVHNVPNGQIGVASNMTRLWARVNLDVAVAYDTDIAAATALIDRIGDEMAADPEWGDRILEPPKVIRVDALADSGVMLKVLGQVRAAQQWAVTGELRKRLLAAFAEAGIEIPFPHRVIVSRQARSGESEAAASADGAGEGDA